MSANGGDLDVWARAAHRTSCSRIDGGDIHLGRSR